MKKTLYWLVLIVVLVIATVLIIQHIQSIPTATPATQNAGTAAVPSTPSGATVGVESISTPSQTASAEAAISGGEASRVISWHSSDYPAGTGVNINLLRRAAGSAASYSLVAQIAKNAPNTGSFTWTPTSGETGSDLYIEVTCPTSSTGGPACQVTSQPVPVN